MRVALNGHGVAYIIKHVLLLLGFCVRPTFSCRRGETINGTGRCRACESHNSTHLAASNLLRALLLTTHMGISLLSCFAHFSVFYFAYLFTFFLSLFRSSKKKMTKPNPRFSLTISSTRFFYYQNESAAWMIHNQEKREWKFIEKQRCLFLVLLLIPYNNKIIV